MLISDKKEENAMEKNLTTGSVFKNVILFSLPYLLSYFLQTLYGMADLFIIGQYDGVASTTAVSVGSQIMHMITVMIVGLAMGTTVSIAQAIGADNKKQASKAVGNTIVLFMGVAIVGMALLLMLVHPIVSVMSTPAEAVNGTVTYLTICFIISSNCLCNTYCCSHRKTYNHNSNHMHDLRTDRYRSCACYTLLCQ